mmetsp:Transcript_60037/g.127159  ORF Transcript_60037/g.127159 Transcript_60037/m.127159 type:complete len:387 (-) Transcript_60037:55-1215(-)
MLSLLDEAAGGLALGVGFVLGRLGIANHLFFLPTGLNDSLFCFQLGLATDPRRVCLCLGQVANALRLQHCLRSVQLALDLEPHHLNLTLRFNQTNLPISLCLHASLLVLQFRPLLSTTLCDQDLFSASFNLFDLHLGFLLDLEDFKLLLSPDLVHFLVELRRFLEIAGQGRWQPHRRDLAIFEGHTRGHELVVQLLEHLGGFRTSQFIDIGVRLGPDKGADGLVHNTSHEVIEVGGSQGVDELLRVGDAEHEHDVDVDMDVIRGGASRHWSIVGARLVRDHIGDTPIPRLDVEARLGDAAVGPKLLHQAGHSRRDLHHHGESGPGRGHEDERDFSGALLLREDRQGLPAHILDLDLHTARVQGGLSTLRRHLSKLKERWGSSKEPR